VKSLGYSVVPQPDDNDTLLVTSPDLPRVVTFGDTREQALHHAVDAIESALASMIDDEVDVPAPQPKHERFCAAAAVSGIQNSALPRTARRQYHANRTCPAAWVAWAGKSMTSSVSITLRQSIKSKRRFVRSIGT
jgi:predicted RNase H-like HicB family nuclease